MQTSLLDRAVSALAAALIVAGAVAALVLGLSFTANREAPSSVLEAILPSRSAPPSPTPSPTFSSPPRAETKARAARDQAAPAARRNQAAQVVLPPPVVPPLVTPPPVPVSIAAGTGSAPNQGASLKDGAGTGAGDAGSGSGGGGTGSGSGGAVRRDLAAYPQQTSGKLHYWEIPKELRRDHGGVIRLRYMIGTDGRVSDCTVIQSSGLADFDRATCERITGRFRFRPARSRDGHAVPFEMTETHGWDYEPAP